MRAKAASVLSERRRRQPTHGAETPKQTRACVRPLARTQGRETTVGGFSENLIFFYFGETHANVTRRKQSSQGPVAAVHIQPSLNETRTFGRRRRLVCEQNQTSWLWDPGSRAGLEGPRRQLSTESWLPRTGRDGRTVEMVHRLRGQQLMTTPAGKA